MQEPSNASQAQLALCFLKDVGPQAVRYLIDHFGTAESIFEADSPALHLVPSLKKSAIHSVLNPAEAFTRAAEEIDFIEKHNITAHFYTSPSYPQRLLQAADFPILLYSMGSANLNHPRIVSVVGTRNATLYGKDLCKQLITFLADYDVLILSGLAYGIDIAAHTESIKAGMPTIGVLGHGLQMIYPGAHRNTARQMLSNGGLLTEFPSHTGPERYNFPQRNRIIAGMADAVIIVEASAKGGALITAEIANSYNKDVFAFPGRINDKFSEGCNFLIKTFRAGLINAPKDLAYNMGWQPVVKSAPEPQLDIKLSADESRIIEALRHADLNFDQLSYVLKMTSGKLSMVLLNLEMREAVLCLPGKVYRIKNA